jgi:hypothetical protein
MNWLVTDAIASTPAYFVGWMASGYYVAGDIRDTIEALYQHDNVGAGLNAIGIVPFAGDGERTMNALRKVTTKYPGRAVELCQFLIKQDVIQRIPYESVKIWILDLCHSNGATELLGANIPIERIYAVAGDGINLHRHFEGLLKIINSGRSVSDKVGSAAEIIASEGVLKSEFPETLYTIYNNVKLIGYNSREIGEIDHVIVEKASGNVIAIIQTKQTQRKLEDALRQLSANRITINDLTGFIETSVGAALTPEKFRAVTVSELKVGPNEGIGFDYVVEYTSKELDALWHTLWFG